MGGWGWVEGTAPNLAACAPRVQVEPATFYSARCHCSTVDSCDTLDIVTPISVSNTDWSILALPEILAS